jgi:FkbM family methyltransferase
MTPGDTFECPSDLASHCNRVLTGEYDVPTPVAPKIVLDIGASVGPFTRWAMAQWPEAEIHAFDPLTEHADFFARNTAAANGRIHFSKLAVRREPGPALLRRGLHNSGESSFFDLGEQTADTTPVSCVGAARLPRADLVKIDTEGCELEIIESLDLSGAKTIVLEYHSETDAHAIKKLLFAKGYKLYIHQTRCTNRGLLKFVAAPLVGHTFIGIPLNRTMDALAVQSLARLVASKVGHLHVHDAIGDSLAPRARNLLTADFLDSACDTLLWIDSDLCYTPDQVTRILAHPEELVGGIYPKKKLGPAEWVVNTLEPCPSVRPDGLQQVRFIGTGFLRIRRSVFERMLDRHRDEIAYHLDGHPDTIQYDLWPVGVYRYPDGFTRYLSEDWYFCQRWLDLGGSVWADLQIQLPHIGSCVYPALTGQSGNNREGPLHHPLGNLQHPQHH